MKRGKVIKPLPYPVYFWVVVAIALTGLADSIYLAISHYRIYTDIGYMSFCAISKAINCDTISQSPYSIFFGVPVPVWGIVGYTFFLLLMPFAWLRHKEEKHAWTIMLLVSFAFSIYSLVLALISTYYIHSYCIMCIFSYGVNLFLLYFTWLVRKRYQIAGIINGTKQDILFLLENKKKGLLLFTPLTGVVVLMLIGFPSYWLFSSPPPISASIASGLTEDGHPWIGAENPELVITEFSDYQCFQCKKMHFFLRQLINGNPDKIRLVHHHFPLDNKVNPIVKEPLYIGSGAMAIVAIFASTKNRFWEMNDILFEIALEKQSINIPGLAKRAGLDPKETSRALFDRKYRNRLARDISEGIKLGISGTPAYLINDNVYSGQIPPDILKTY